MRNIFKIEKSLKNGQVSILFRDRLSFSNKTFLLACCFAIAFHLLFFTVFHIAPYRVPFESTNFFPVNVESSIDLKNVAAVVNEEIIPSTFHGIAFPSAENPNLSANLVFIPIKNFEQPLMKSSFDEFQSELYIPLMEVPKKVPKKLMNVVISGPLSEVYKKPQGIIFRDGKVLNLDFQQDSEKDFQNDLLKFDQNFAYFLDHMSSLRLKDLRLGYKVRVLGDTGKVFWFESLEESESEDEIFSQLAESVLRNLTFDTDLTSVEISGEVEIHFHKGVL